MWNIALPRRKGQAWFHVHECQLSCNPHSNRWEWKEIPMQNDKWSCRSRNEWWLGSSCRWNSLWSSRLSQCTTKIIYILYDINRWLISIKFPFKFLVKNFLTMFNFFQLDMHESNLCEHWPNVWNYIAMSEKQSKWRVFTKWGT